MKKRILSILLVIMMLVGMLPTTIFATEEASVTAGDWYGDGSATEFVIDTVDELKEFAALVNSGTNFNNKTVKLDADLDLNNEEWTPIGSAKATSFCGVFDGQGHTVSNLMVIGNNNFAGLFGYVGTGGGDGTRGTIKNLNIYNADVSGAAGVAAVAGYGNPATIEKCNVTGIVKITSSNFYSGVIVGGYIATVKDCHVSGSITIDAYAGTGGIAGYGYWDIDNCSVTGQEGSSIRGASYVGGIAGWTGEGTHVISNCSVKSIALTGTDTTGGIVGMANYNMVIKESSVDALTITTNGTDGTVGTIAGTVNGTAQNPTLIVNNAVANTTVNGAASTTQTSGLTSNGAANANYAVGQNVELDNNNKVVSGHFSVFNPDIAGMILSANTELVANKDGTYNAEEKSSWDGVTISNAEELFAFAEAVNGGDTYAGKTVTLTADIDLSGYVWNGIGEIDNDYANGVSFQGIFEGGNHTISNVTFANNVNGNKYRGFFNEIRNATVQNLTVETNGFEASVTGSYGGAVLVGHAYESTIQNCVSMGTLTGTHNVAGIVIRAKDAKIINCTNRAALSSSGTKIGGIICLTQNSQEGCLVEGCINEGIITCTGNGGTNGVGGIIGWIGYPGLDLAGTGSADEIPVTISNCQNKGLVQAAGDAVNTALVGEIVGMPHHYWDVQDGNKGTTAQLAVGTSNSSGFNFALIENDVANYVTAIEAGNTYLVTAKGSTASIKLNPGESISFDQTLAAVNATGITAETELVTTEEGAVITYTAKELPAAEVYGIGSRVAISRWLDEATGKYKFYIFCGIDSLNYREVGFILTASDGQTKKVSTDTVYSKITDSKGATYSYEAFSTEDYEVYRIFSQGISFAEEFAKDNSLTYQPYAVTLDGETIYGKAYTADPIYK